MCIGVPDMATQTSSAEDHRCSSCRPVHMTLLSLGFLFLVFPLAMYLEPFWTNKNARNTKKVEEVTKIMIPSTMRSVSDGKVYAIPEY